LPAPPVSWAAVFEFQEWARRQIELSIYGNPKGKRMTITAKELYDATMRGEGPLARHAKDNPEMPVFLLLAQDQNAAALVEKWATWVSVAVPSAGGGATGHKVSEARQIAELMRMWPFHKVPD
jgi:hypothetical protein